MGKFGARDDIIERKKISCRYDLALVFVLVQVAKAAQKNESKLVTRPVVDSTELHISMEHITKCTTTSPFRCKEWWGSTNGGPMTPSGNSVLTFPRVRSTDPSSESNTCSSSFTATAAAPVLWNSTYLHHKIRGDRRSL